MTDIELCYKCNDDPATLNNMQSIIITGLLKSREDAKMVIRAIPDDKEVVRDFRKTIVANTKAITVFYKRFPDLTRIQLSDKVMERFNVPKREKRRHFMMSAKDKSDFLKVFRLCREINDYATILRGLDNIKDNEAIEKAVNRIKEYHKQLKSI